jgi:HPt (histidine-containing phosphotransfer) domain-containing protein
MAATGIAFAAPENASGACPSNARPIDLVHLARQTMGDKTLEAEVLRMFARQLRIGLQDIGAGDPDKRKAALHLLKGAASAVGAFPLADAVAACETRPAEAASLSAVAKAVIEVENFILRLSR